MSQVLQPQLITPEPVDLLRLPDDLTIKQKLFVYYYIETRNATKAAELAGYSGDRNTIATTGWDNLQKPAIKSALEQIYQQKLASPANILAEASDIATAPWREFVEVKTDPVTGAVINAQLRLSDKLKAIELVGKHHKLFTDKVETSLSESDAERLAEQFFKVIQGALEKRQQAQRAVVDDGDSNKLLLSPAADTEDD